MKSDEQYQAYASFHFYTGNPKNECQDFKENTPSMGYTWKKNRLALF